MSSNKMKTKFDKCWGECNLLMAIAAVLDPRCKMMLVEFSFKQIYPLEEAQVNVFKVKSTLTSLFCDYKSAIQNSSESSNTQSSSTNESSHDVSNSGSMSSNKKPKLSGWSRFDSFVRSCEHVPPEKSELEVYLEDGIFRCEESGSVTFDALEWWKSNQLKYKVLSKMACDILAIPASTVASEATFSAGSRVLDPYRASLSTDTVEMLMFGGDWVRRLHRMKKKSKIVEEEPLEIFLPSQTN